VYALNLDIEATGPLQILCIGAHCDDIELGCGGTLLALQQRYPDCRIHWLVLTSNPTRQQEALAAAKSFVAGSALGDVHIGKLPDGLLPAHFAEVKALFESVKATLNPNLILTHCASDRHQDHLLASAVTWQTFREHLIWEYEIPKYDGDLTTPNTYIPLPATTAAQKVDLIVRTFESQKARSWFSAENLLAVMRMRGLECRSASGFAEAFHCRKFVFGMGR
jgi:LmbE family N-acetylglucosaminyl deacetylase